MDCVMPRQALGSQAGQAFDDDTFAKRYLIFYNCLDNGMRFRARNMDPCAAMPGLDHRYSLGLIESQPFCRWGRFFGIVSHGVILGIESTSRRVNSCFGARKISFGGPDSTIRPSCRISTRWLMEAMERRSCEINRIAVPSR